MTFSVSFASFDMRRPPSKAWTMGRCSVAGESPDVRHDVGGRRLRPIPDIRRRSRRAHESEAKSNAGAPAAIAEVVRDLHRNAGQPDQSFSERQIYEAAMDRLAAELAALDQTDKMTALIKLGNFLKTL